MLYMLYVLYIYTYYLETICPTPGSTEVYQIPPASSSTGHKADDWKPLDSDGNPGRYIPYIP